MLRIVITPSERPAELNICLIWARRLVEGVLLIASGCALLSTFVIFRDCGSRIGSSTRHSKTLGNHTDLQLQYTCICAFVQEAKRCIVRGPHFCSSWRKTEASNRLSLSRGEITNLLLLFLPGRCSACIKRSLLRHHSHWEI